MKKPNALIIFAKPPWKEISKTRLRGFLTDEERILIHSFMLEDTIGKLRGTPDAEIIISYWPESSGEFFLRYGLKTFPQRGKDIGERMHNAMQDALRGRQKAVIAGSDIPDISPEDISEAFESLSSNDVVFGPARDGGYYLVGMKRPIKGIFAGIGWSAPSTLKESLGKAEALGLKTALLKRTLSDVDTPKDVKETGILLRAKGPARPRSSGAA